MDCVEDCGYNNFSLSRVMARIFSLKNTPLNMWVMWVYIVWVETWYIRYDKLAKQNVSQVSRRKALLTRHYENFFALHFALSFTLSLTHDPYKEILHKIQGT